MQIGHYCPATWRGPPAWPLACRVETHLDARRFEIAPSKSVETNLDAADTSVRATKTRC